MGPVHHVTQSQCQPLPISSVHTTGPMLRAELRTQPLRIDQPPQTQPKSSQTKEFSPPPRNSNQCGMQLLLLPSFPVWVGKLRLKRFIQVYLGTQNKKLLRADELCDQALRTKVSPAGRILGTWARGSTLCCIQGTHGSGLHQCMCCMLWLA